MSQPAQQLRDLTEEDENNLPLPDDWVRTIKTVKTADSDRRQKIYRNLKTGIESEEHPFILQALNMSRKQPLPVGWVVKEVVYKDGSKDYSYYNTELGVSMWDPPLLRECLSECLLVSGFNPYALHIVPEQPHDNHDHGDQIDEEDDALIEYHNQASPKEVEEEDEDDGALLNYYNKDDLPDCEPPSDAGEELQPLAEDHRPLTLEDLNEFDDLNDYMEGSTDGSLPTTTRNWQGLLDTHRQQNRVFVEKLSHRVRHVRPPVSTSGVAVLKADVTEANERIHQLLIQLRTVLCAKAGIECSYLYHSSAAGEEYDALEELDVQQRNRFVTLASDIVTTLRQHPENIVLAMSATNKPGNPAMVQIAHTAIHRLLHPFSTDNSMTTALLLQGINYQLDEMTLVEQIFSDNDSRRILSRALLISDPALAIRWNPVSAPLPVVPVAREETVLACLLRLYAVRRDVTSYYRTAWKPMMPAVVAVLNSDKMGAHVFGNLMAVANRLLECTLGERALLSFPPTASAICRAMFEIGGQHTLHAYMFHFLILPNLVKILAGDHESVENENVYRLDTVRAFVDKYFDSSLWLSSDSDSPSGVGGNGGGLPFNPLRALIWLVWRLYQHAIYVRGSALTILTTPDFVGDRLPRVDLSAVPDNKLKNIVERLHRKIERSSEYLLRLPLDAQGSEYLGVDPSVNLLPVTDSAEMIRLMNRRMTGLHFKPNEMLNLAVVSKHDIGNLFTDVGVALEISGQSETSALYQQISEYLSLCSADDGDESREEIVQLLFLYSKKSRGGEPLRRSGDTGTMGALLEPLDAGAVEEEFTSEVEMSGRHAQLLRGLALTNRYEDILIQMIMRAENNKEYSVFDLVANGTKLENGVELMECLPEFDTRATDDVRLSNVHTEVSVQKLKGSHFGLHTPAQVPTVPMYSKGGGPPAQEERVNYHDRDKKFFASYRFGTASSSVNAGTSMARSLTLPPRLDVGSVREANVKTVKNSRTRNSRSQYTKLAIKSDASILMPTESYKSPALQRVTPAMIDKEFLKSMRGHEVIPTDEFQQRHDRRMRGSSGDEASARRMTSRRRVSAAPPPSAPIHAPQPFPEYLRPRVRGDGVEEPYQPTPKSSQSVQSGRSKRSVRKSNTHPVSVDINQIIKDYKQLFVNSQPHSLSYNPQPGERTYSNTPTGHRMTHKRAGSPSLPRPIPGTTFFAPTQSLLKKMELDQQNVRLGSSSNFKNSMLTEMAQGVLPGLRNYPCTSNFVAPPFIPTHAKQYAPTGARIPRVPDFLSDDSRSRGSSRSNSRASSPALSRSSSRNGSYNNLSRLNQSEVDDFAPQNTSDHYYDVGYGSPEGFQDSFQVEYDDSSARFVLNSNTNTATAAAAAAGGLSSEEVFRQQQRRQQAELAQEESDYLRRSSAVKSPLQPTQQPVSVRPSDQSVDSAPSARKKVPVAMSSQGGSSPVKQRDDGLNQSGRDFPLSARRSFLAAEIPVASPPPSHRPNVWSEAVSAAISASADSSDSTPAKLVASAGRRASFNAPSAAQSPPPAVVVPAPPAAAQSPAPVVVPTIPSPAPHLSSQGTSPGFRRSSTGQMQAGAEVSPNARSPPQRRASVATAGHHSAPFRSPLAPSLTDASAAKRSPDGPPVIVVPPPPVAHSDAARPGGPSPLASVTPLSQSSYAIRFDEIGKAASVEAEQEEQEHDNDVHHYRYDTNKDKRREHLLGGPASQDEDDSEYGEFEGSSRYIMDSPLRPRGGAEGRFHQSSMGRIPIIKKKSMILTKDESKTFLTKGFRVTKHGRSGAPKQKFVYLNEEDQCIQWFNAKSSVFSSLFSGGSSKEKPSFIPLDSVLEVRKGIQSQVFMRAKLVDPRCCLSIVTDERTLDLACSNPSERDIVIKGLGAVFADTDVKFL